MTQSPLRCALNHRAIGHRIGERHAQLDYGRTGAREEMSAEAEKLVKRVRRFSDLPIAVGFGISTPEHVIGVWRFADAAVVGSALVAEIERHSNRVELVTAVGKLARNLSRE